MKAVLEKEGDKNSKTGLPRQIFKAAYSAGILPEEEVLIDILEDRNYFVTRFTMLIERKLLLLKFVKIFADISEVEKNS